MPPMNPTKRSKALYDACHDRDWETVMELCSCEVQSEETANFKAHYQGERDRTCLHEAVKKWAPCRVIRAIIDAHKEFPVCITRATDIHEETALHLAADAFWFIEAAVLQLLVESDPHCATMRDEDGCTPLHHLVTVYDKAEVSASKVACARALLNASTTESILLLTDKDKRTTLHEACLCSQTTPEIVKMILEHCPQAALAKDSDGDTPLHCVARYVGYDNFNCAKIILLLESLTTQGRFGAAALNNNGQTPLHLVICYADKDATKLLIDSLPEIVCIKDKDGMTPLDCLQEAYPQIMRCKTYEQVVAAYSKPEHDFCFENICEKCNLLAETMLSVLHGHEKLTGEESLWMTTEQERSGNEENLEFAIIHNYLRLGLCCPLDFVLIFMRLYPHQTQMKDARGVLPLHIALENGVQHVKHSTIGYDSSDFIKELIDAYPEAAKVPNCNGDLPFHILLQSRGGNSGWLHVVQPLLRAHPAALLYGKTDLLHVLLPLILSRVGEGADVAALYDFVRETIFVVLGNISLKDY